MNAMRKQYVVQLRQNSHYPMFRRVIGFVTAIGLIAALIVVVGAFSSGSPVIGIVSGSLIAVAVLVLKEVSEMVADIADATLDGAYRSSTAGQ